MKPRAWMIAACLQAACSQREQEHEHPHEAQATEELPAQSVTVWTDSTELFMEYQPLIAGRPSRFAAHVTALRNFHAVSEGTVALTITLEDGATLTSRAEASQNPGIFRPNITPSKAGKCRMSFAVASKAVEDQFAAGPCEIHPTLEAARVAAEDEAPPQGRVPFLKEQQWKTEFMTAAVAERDLQPAIAANGEIRAASGREALLASSSAGRAALTDPPPLLGMKVKKGDLLATIAPRLSSGTDRASLESEVIAARAELEAALAQKARAERLFSDQAVPERNVEEARARAEVAKARADAAAARVALFTAGASGASGAASASSYQIRSPIAGTLVLMEVSSGAAVPEGAPLFTVIDLSRVWVEARVFETDIPKVEHARGGWFTVEGRDEPFVIDEKSSRLITVGHVIDPKSRTVPIIFDVENPNETLRIGQFAKVSIAIGEVRKTLAIPESAIVDENGKPIAFVQVEGESFERRPLTIGIRDRGLVEVLGGVAVGEHVVTKGAYEVKLASASGAIPAHGHVH